MDEIREVEARLRRDLQHVPPPAGFTDRVLRRVVEREVTRQLVGQRQRHRAGFFTGAHRHTTWWTAVAAALALSVGGGEALHLRHLRQMREAAAMQAQIELAMQLTSHALDEVQTGLGRSRAGRFTQIFYETGR